MDLRHTADVRGDDQLGGEAQLPLHPACSEAPHCRQAHPHLPQVLHAKEQTQADN